MMISLFRGELVRRVGLALRVAWVLPAAAAGGTGDGPAARFDATEAKAVAAPGQGVVELRYRFTNTGGLPLAVEEFVQTCGCMTGEWDGVPVEPGASGWILARFLTGGLRGTVRKSLHVKFVESGTVELAAEVRIPESVVYSAQTLRWTVGAEPEPRQVEIAVAAGQPARVLSVSANDPSFACELLTVEEARSYRITVTPRDTAAARVCVLQVRTDSKDPRDALKGLFAVVEQPDSRGGPP